MALEIDKKINYIEFPAKNMAQTKNFFEQLFGWTFTDYGPDYCAINDAGIGAGFYLSELTMTTAQGSALIVLYSNHLTRTQQQVVDAGGQICKPMFTFPGGRRFHFLDPNGNEFAVWSDQ